jgi:hypothetical protein
MKHILKGIFSTMAIVAILSITACSKKDDPTVQDQIRAMLTAGTWKIQTATVGEEDAMDFFDNLHVTFTAEGFSSVNGGPVWPASGSWNFTNDEATHIVRNDGVDITLISVTDNRLECSLYWDELVVGPGRTSAVEGTHTFVFTK